MFCGMKEIVIQGDTDLSTQNHFQIGSLIFYKTFVMGIINISHNTKMRTPESLWPKHFTGRKMQIAGLPEDSS